MGHVGVAPFGRFGIVDRNDANAAGSVFPDPGEARVEKENLWVIELEKLIELKLSSGRTAPHRLKDLADVQELILHLHLPLSLAERLDESVRAEYRKLWDAAETGRAAEENP